MTTFSPGDRFYYYVVQRLLGTGLHGEVYEIQHQETGDSFALKVIPIADTTDPNKVARALVSAKANYRIEHRNVLRVYDLNCEPNGLVWLRSELLRGRTLQSLVQDLGPLSVSFALSLAIEAAHGLEAIHEAQVVHRDIKPANLFYTESGVLKILDLSLAKVFPEGLETTVGRLGLGTPAYMAPEQLEARGPAHVGFDVYGLGMTLWEMLAGRHPYQDALGCMQELLKRQLTEMPASLLEVAGVPAPVEAVVRRAVAKDPTERYPNMRALCQALTSVSAWLSGEARAGRWVPCLRPGEPAPPVDPHAWRDYHPPTPTPEVSVPPSGPRQRVLVKTPPNGPLAGTVALDQPLALLGGATLPFDGGPLPVQPAVRPRLAPTIPMVISPEAPPQETTPDVATHTLSPPMPGARRLPWMWVVPLLVVAGFGTGAVVRLCRAPSCSISHTSGPAAPMRTAEAPSSASGTAILSPEPPAPPSAPTPSTSATSPGTTRGPRLPSTVRPADRGNPRGAQHGPEPSQPPAPGNRRLFGSEREPERLF